MSVANTTPDRTSGHDLPGGAEIPPGPSQRAQRLGDLLTAARGGDRSALDQLVVDLTPTLWQVARSQGLDRTAAEDVVQAAWLTLLRHLHDLRAPEALIGWLVTVTKREAWRSLKASHRVRPGDAEEFDRPDPAPAPPDQVELAEQRQVLWEAVGRLSRRCQQLLRVVAFVPRPDYARISEAFDMPKGSIGPTRGRCLAQLRVELAKDPRWGRS
jgi:RNA polymerase sigma factor (sigma-70 family)